MNEDARKNPYADQPLAYYPQGGAAAPAGQSSAQGQAPQYGQTAYGQAPSGYGQAPSGYGQAPQASASAEELQRLYQAPDATAAQTHRATMNDVVVKTLILLGLLVVGGAVGWIIPALGILGSLVGFVLAMVVIFKKKTSPGLIIAYAVAEGMFLGTISSLFEAQFGGIVAMAVVATVALFAGMLALYAKAGMRIGPRTAMVVGIAMVAYLVFLLGNIVYGGVTGYDMRDVEIFGIPLGIPLGLVVVALGAISLVMDFQNIEGALRAGVPEKESWRLAFGLIVTLVWLYVEILRLLSYFNNRD